VELNVDLARLLDNAAEAGKPFDIGATMHYFAYEVSRDSSPFFSRISSSQPTRTGRL
jgi:hypothetical protein